MNWVMVVNVLLGGDGIAIAESWQKVPIFQCCQHFVVDGWVQALQHYLIGNVSPLVDCDLYDNVSLRGVAQVPWIDSRFGAGNPNGGTDFRAIGFAVGKRSIK